MPYDDSSYTPDFQTPGQITANRAYAEALMKHGVNPGSSNVMSGGIAYASPLSPLVAGMQGMYGRALMNRAGAQEQRRQNEPVASMLREPIPGEPNPQGYTPPGSPSASTSGSLGFSGENPYGDVTLASASQYGVDPNILHRQLKQESGFKNLGPNRAGAMGIAQFTGETARDRGVNAMDPYSAIPGAAAYDAELSRKYGNVGLGLAAYNWGPRRVESWLASGADPRRVPAETRNYVQSITGRPIEAWVADRQTGSAMGHNQLLQFAGPGAGGGDTPADNPQSAMALALARGGNGMQPPGPGAPSMAAPSRVPIAGEGDSPYIPGSFFPQRQQVSRETMGKMMTGDVDPSLRTYMGTSYFGQYQPAEREAQFGYKVVRDAQGNEMFIPPAPYKGTEKTGDIETPVYQYPTLSGQIKTMESPNAGGAPIKAPPQGAGSNIPKSRGFDIDGGKNDIDAGSSAKPVAPKPRSEAEPAGGKPAQLASLETGTVSDAPPPGALGTSPPSAGPALAYAPPTVTAAADTAPTPGGVKVAQAATKHLTDMTVEERANYSQDRALALEQGKKDQADFNDEYKAHQKSMQTAKVMQPQLQLLESIFKRPELYQGPWSGAKQAINDAFTAMTGNEKTTISSNLSGAVKKLVSTNILGQMREQLQGLGQVRLMEIALLAQSSASQENTPQANAAIMFIARKLAGMAVGIGKVSQAYHDGVRWDEDGKMLTDHASDRPTSVGQNEAINTYLEKHPTMSGSEMDDLEKTLTTGQPKQRNRPTPGVAPGYTVQ